MDNGLIDMIIILITLITRLVRDDIVCLPIEAWERRGGIILSFKDDDYFKR
jgi:hypothetical protein